MAVPVLIFLVSACSSATDTDSRNENVLQVVTTTSLLADLAKNVGGDLVEVTALVPPGADVHSFQSTPADSVAVSRAALVITNGGGLDEFLNPVVNGSISNDAVRVIAADPLLDQSALIGAGGRDPHFWQDPQFAVTYVEGIRDGLITADPANADAYHANFDSYRDELIKLDFDIVSTLNTVDEAHRRLITFHDAFGHFARRYGWEATSLVASDASQVSPGQVVETLERVREQGIPAVFAEPQFRSDVLNSAAQEAGIEVGLIYSDVQGEEAASYIDMMLFNAKSMARLLR